MTGLQPPRGATDPRSRMDAEAQAETLADANSRAYPAVAGQLVRRDRAGLALGASVALLLGAATLFGLTMSRASSRQDPVPEPSPTAAATAPSIAPASALAQPAPVMTMPAPLPGAVAGPVGTVPPAVMPAAMSVGPAPGDSTRAPALVFDAATTAGPPPVAEQPRAPARPTLNGPGLTEDEQFVQRLAGSDSTVSANTMAAPEATVAQGTLIAAVLETGINSDLPGFVRAVISRDVRSYDGRQVLIPRGSHVIGEYKSGLAVGQTRAFVLWTRLLRPDGVSVALGSPATDSAGNNGLPGKVNSHFGKRFGAAILLSMIGAAGQAAGSGSAVVIAAPTQTATSIVQRDANIPPTVKVDAGKPIRIFVARDLDFSGVTAGR